MGCSISTPISCSLEGKRIATLTISDSVTPMSVGLAWHRQRELSP